MELSALLANYALQFVSATPVVIVCAKIITTFVPTQLHTKKTGVHIDLANLILRVLNEVSLNVGKNRNIDDPKAKK